MVPSNDSGGANRNANRKEGSMDKWPEATPMVSSGVSHMVRASTAQLTVRCSRRCVKPTLEDLMRAEGHGVSI